MKRRANIKFLSSSKIQITTLFCQKTFTLDKDNYIDLITLKKVPKKIKFKNKLVHNPEILPLKFYANIDKEEGEFQIFVYAETEEGFNENIGIVTKSDVSRFFEVSIKQK